MPSQGDASFRKGQSHSKWTGSAIARRRALVLAAVALAGFIALVAIVGWPASFQRRPQPSSQTPSPDRSATTQTNVLRGRDGWLFYEPDVRHLSGPPFDAAAPVAAIVDLRRQLAARGIALVVLPIPSKAAIHPEMLWPREVPPSRSPSMERFTQQLRSAGVLVMDPEAALLAAARGGEKQYLVADTHFRPEAADLVAREIAAFIEKNVPLPQTLPIRYTRQDQAIDGVGDLAEMQGLAALHSSQRVTIQRVMRPDGSAWSPDRGSEILFLGDSFSTIYAYDEMGWGSAAGLVEQLSFHLGRPIDAIRRNDGGTLTNRQMLAAELARGQDRLAGKKLVIWEFASRELSLGDWQNVDLVVRNPPATSPVDQSYILPPPGQLWHIEGTVAAMGEVPDVRNSAYRDHIVAVHLTEVTVQEPPRHGVQAVIYLRSLVDAKRTPAAELKPGRRIRMVVRDWRDVSRRYELIRISDLPDARLKIRPACWGELAQ